jgi:hypothetical protein
MRNAIAYTALAAILVAALPARADSSALSGLSFLVGSWKSDDGKVADTGGTSKGTSVITSEAGGAALLRRDHTDLFDKSGKLTGGFDQIMLIYADGPSLHAEYADGQHIIHYTSAEIVTGKSVTFSTTQGAGPVFRLTYEATAPDALKITFGMVPPGQTAFHLIATGTVHRISN